MLVFTNPKVGTTYNDNFICIQIDVDRDPHKISRRYDISGVPAFVFAEPSGTIVYSETGYHEIDECIALTEIPLAYQNGSTTPVQNLIIATERNPEREDEDIHQHFDQHRSTYIQLAGQDRIDLFLAERALTEVQEEIQEAIQAKKEPNWARTENALKAQLDDRYLKHFYETKTLYFFYIEDWLQSIDYSVNATGEEEIEAYETFYTLLKKAEQLLSPPTADLYEQLAYVCYILDRYEESDKYEELKEQAAK